MSSPCPEKKLRKYLMAYEGEIYILQKQVTKLSGDMPELVYQKIYYKIANKKLLTSIFTYVSI